jgi:uncharacterized protein YbjT (DUF2867 family)
MTVTLVTGGARGLGADVTRALLARGERPRVLTHRAGATVPDGAEIAVGDLRDGSSLNAALAGVSTIIHCASDARESRFDTEIQGARNLTQSAADAGVGRLLYVSIVGVDQSDYPYYMAKRQAERIIEASPTPWSILRATQFHDLVYALLREWDSGAGALRVAPNMSFQSVARVEVAARLVELADGRAAGYVLPMRGPETLGITEMAVIYLAALGRAENVESFQAGNTPPSVFQTGVNLLADDALATRGKQTWADYMRGKAPGGSSRS